MTVTANYDREVQLPADPPAMLNSQVFQRWGSVGLGDALIKQPGHCLEI